LESDSLDQLDKNIFIRNSHIKLMYAGNIGHAQDWEPLLELALRLKDKPFDFYVIGEGVMKSYVENRVALDKLHNVFVLPYQPRHLMPKLLSFADLQYIFMSKEMEGHGFPSKVYTIMACSRPLLVCSGQETPIVNFLEPINCAHIITETDLDKKVQQMVGFLTNQTEQSLRIIGERGLEEVRSYYSKEVVINKYVSIVDNLLV
jgi:glycosyltransferase involved in cell wall biosynthesis